MTHVLLGRAVKGDASLFFLSANNLSESVQLPAFSSSSLSFLSLVIFLLATRGLIRAENMQPWSSSPAVNM